MNKPTNLGVSDALASLFNIDEQKRRRKPHTKKLLFKAPKRAESVNNGFPQWDADKAKREAQRLFVKGFITRQEARKRIVKADADFNAFMQRLKGVDVSSAVTVRKGESNGK